jgi:DNA-binding response OmpR family regulator
VRYAMPKILLVEDNQQIAKNIKTYLELEEGREVATSYDGEKGLMMAKIHNYDLILLDLMLPGVDGKSFCQAIKKIKNTPIIIITAKSQLEDKLELFDL